MSPSSENICDSSKCTPRTTRPNSSLSRSVLASSQVSTLVTSWPDSTRCMRSVLSGPTASRTLVRGACAIWAWIALACQGSPDARLTTVPARPGPRRPAPGSLAIGAAALPCAAVRLARERAMRCGAPRLPLQAAQRSGRTSARRVSTAFWDPDSFLAGKRDPGAARLGQADGDRLLRGRRAVLTFAHVLDFLAHELACGGAGTFSLAQLSARACCDAFLRHRASLALSWPAPGPGAAPPAAGGRHG